MYRFSGKRHLRWLLQRIKPFLEFYYAPYNKHTRHWTGLLLLLRCALYIVFSYNSLEGEKMGLLAIIIAFTGITITAWLSVKIYKRFFVNLIEASVYLNLIMLSSATLAEIHNPALTYSLVGIVLVTMMCIIAYHFHILYIGKTTLWRKASGKLRSLVPQKDRGVGDDATVNTGVSSHDPTKIVTQTHIELREPLLEK